MMFVCAPSSSTVSGVSVKEESEGMKLARHECTFYEGEKGLKIWDTRGLYESFFFFFNYNDAGFP